MITNPNETSPMDKRNPVTKGEREQFTFCAICKSPVPNILGFCPMCGQDMREQAEYAKMDLLAPATLQKITAIAKSFLNADPDQRLKIMYRVKTYYYLLPAGEHAMRIKAQLKPVLAYMAQETTNANAAATEQETPIQTAKRAEQVSTEEPPTPEAETQLREVISAVLILAKRLGIFKGFAAWVGRNHNVRGAPTTETGAGFNRVALYFLLSEESILEGPEQVLRLMFPNNTYDTPRALEFFRREEARLRIMDAAREAELKPEKPTKYRLRIAAATRTGYGKAGVNEDCFWTEEDSSVSLRNKQLAEALGIPATTSISEPEPVLDSAVTLLVVGDGISQMKASLGVRQAIVAIVEAAYRFIGKNHKPPSRDEWQVAVRAGHEAVRQDHEHLLCLSKNCPATARLCTDRRRASKGEIEYVGENHDRLNCFGCKNELKTQGTNAMGVAVDLNQGNFSCFSTHDTALFIVRGDGEEIRVLADEPRGGSVQLGTRNVDIASVPFGSGSISPGDWIVLMTDGVRDEIVARYFDKLISSKKLVGKNRAIIEPFVDPTEDDRATPPIQRFNRLATAERSVLVRFLDEAYLQLVQEIKASRHRNASLKEVVDRFFEDLHKSAIKRFDSDVDDFTLLVTQVEDNADHQRADLLQSSGLESILEILSTLANKVYPFVYTQN